MARKNISADRVVWTSICVSLLDVLLNIGIAMLTGSVIILAEALQGFADLTTAGLLAIGLRRSKRRANTRYNFGYGREIYFWTLLAGIVMVTVTATLSFRFGIERFFNPQDIYYTTLAYTMLIFAIGTNGYACSLSYRRLHETHPGQFIWKTFLYSDRIETKATFILDLMGTLSAVSGLLSLILYGLTGDGRFDGLGAMVIGLTTAVLAILLVLGVKDFLIGRSASNELVDKIRTSALELKEVAKVLDLRTMYIGTDKLLVTMEVNVSQNLQTPDIERLIDRLKAHVKKDVPSIDHVQVEIETLDS